ncbi:aromatic ring-hydroxylating dioxygenase subunit alpha [Sphingobium sp. HBC34]|uniref:Aromatic ring-hydroxylating dioxygenase subunit alpha n=1 Tax=Sphingobium cyanobacteriorum TaxID=3063954 RepID=A0ABT8ZTK3_9SPHN|nr:aromatic ring-hydroxylating dioxygenase subunit alpha [Sphingobium sp. HBC34]MDO7837309.1 aromatic ring-hydroxylating dioxygenase subunit alpha [Sphingobium sp. HBC34]
MNWLRNCWYQAGWADEVSADTPLVRRILNEPILFFRGAHGDVIALVDRCPHRFAPLSAGRIDGDTVTCGYHGLAFGRAGSCVANPHGPVTSKMQVKAYEVVERHGALWVWMGDAADADHGLLPDLSFIDATPESARIQMYMPTAANYQLIADNIMDLSHADYLHPTSIGGIITGADATTREEGRHVIAEWHSSNCVPPPAYAPMVAPSERADIWTQVVWQPPGLMILSTAAMQVGEARTPGHESVTLHNMVPETETTTHYFMCSTRRFLVDNEGFNAMLRASLAHAFLNEDKPMLEKQQRSMGTSDLWALDPVLLKVDAGAVRARRKLDALLDAERLARP